MNQKFVAQTFFETPILFGDKGGLVGDSLLAGVAYREHRDHERAIRELPIAMMDGVAHMSRSLWYTPTTRRESRVTMGASFMRDIDHDRDMIELLDRMPSKSRRRADQGPLSNIQSHYVQTHLSSFYYLGCGDIEKVRRLLNGTSCYGRQISKGHGQIIRTDVFPVDSDNEFFGMVGVRHGRNVVLRPIPLRFRDRFPAQLEFLTSTETWHNPYLPRFPSAKLELCMIPPFQNGESFAPNDIKTLCTLNA